MVLKSLRDKIRSFFKPDKTVVEQRRKEKAISTVQEAFELDMLQWSPSAIGFTSQEFQHNMYDIINQYLEPTDSIIDFGCGRGDFFGYRNNPGSDYFGIDLDPKLIKAGAAKYKNIKIKCLNWFDLDNRNIKKDCAINILSCNVKNEDPWTSINSETYILNVIEKMMSVANKSILTIFTKSFFPIENPNFITYNLDSLTEELNKKNYDVKMHNIEKDVLITLIITRKQ